MSGKIKLNYTNEKGQEVTDHQQFHTTKSARLRAKDLRAAKPGSNSFVAVNDDGETVEFDFPELH